MQLLVIRHAIAEDRAEWAATGEGDAARPLTSDGRRRMRRGARGLRRAVPRLGTLATSPLTRARDTAEIVAEAYGGVDPVLLPELTPGGDPQLLVRRLRALDGDGGPVAIVGHEPDLSGVVGWLLTGRVRSLLELKKGSACLLELPDDAEPAGGATLLWALTPGQLRRLRK